VEPLHALSVASDGNLMTASNILVAQHLLTLVSLAGVHADVWRGFL
jgi:hypothetical protein